MPRIAAGVDSAIIASRGAVRIPLPIRSRIRAAKSCHGAKTSASNVRETAAIV
jgi:hypothetical protein